MNGLVIWAHSYCRSTLAFYIELGKAFNVPTIIFCPHRGCDLRAKVGFSEKEFAGADIRYFDDNVDLALKEFQARKSWNHIFATYQEDLYGRLFEEARRRRVHYAIASEAPCNMEARLCRRLLKHLYIKCVLRNKLRPRIDKADFIINFSGYYEDSLLGLGWEKDKVISCGYYPPPIPGSKCVKRDESNWQNFTILLSGIHQWHRSPMVLLKALNLLQNKGIRFHCYITQEGPLYNELKMYAQAQALTDSVEFLGFVPMERLIELYQTCSVYVGAGSYEPWGMRLNDVLQCGAPIVVSRGMGGAKLIDDYGCGLAFEKGSYRMLASQLELLITDKSKYLECANNAFAAFAKVAPHSKASEIADAIRQINANWS